MINSTLLQILLLTHILIQITHLTFFLFSFLTPLSLLPNLRISNPKECSCSMFNMFRVYKWFCGTTWPDNPNAFRTPPLQVVFLMNFNSFRPLVVQIMTPQVVSPI